MTSAIITDNITDKGTATSTGRKKRKSGTATNASPKPKVDRTKDAKKLMRRINKIVKTEYLLGILVKFPIYKKMSSRGNGINRKRAKAKGGFIPEFLPECRRENLSL